MSYEFSLKKSSAWILAGGLAVAGALVFTAGILVGLNMGAGSLAIARSTQVQSATKPIEAKLIEPKILQKAAPPTPPKIEAATPAPAPKPAVAEAKPEAVQAAVPAAKPAETDAEAEDVYAVQVGAFLDADNAASLVDDLKDRGYKATTIKGMDSRRRVWTAVRVGQFKDLHSASRFAADFTGKEQIQALVRPSATL
jgi:cell division septation protein DedD